MDKNKIFAYHGTSTEAAERIRSEQHFRESRKDNEWLGTGVYFFAFKKDAEDWPIKMYYRLKDSAVLTVQLEYEDQEMLDLDDSAQLLAFDKELEKLEEKISNRSTTNFGGRDEQKRRWCLACNLYRKLHPEIAITSYTFHQGISNIARFQINQKQLCVSKQRIITEII